MALSNKHSNSVTPVRDSNPDMGSKVKSSQGSPRKDASVIAGSTDTVTSGQRGRRSMPAVRLARTRYADAQRRLAAIEKTVRVAKLDLAIAISRKDAVVARARIKAAMPSLKQAKQTLKQVSTTLRQILKVEAAKSRALAQARAVAIYKAKLQAKLDSDWNKVLGRFTAAWKNKCNKIIARKLAARLRKEAAKSRAAARKANAKARESVKRAETLAKARARKATTKARAKARKLAVQAKVKARLVVRKATRKAPLAAVPTSKVSRKKRSK